jgi:CheY-like chemotaxis protein
MPRKFGEILLVDDSSDDVELAVSVLSDCWPAEHIVVAQDGAEAGDYLFRRGAFSGRGPDQPVLILLDVKMPKVDGLELLRIVKNDAQLKSIPVVMLTSSREERDILDSYRLGSNGYVVKPMVYAEFRETLQALGTFWLKTNVLPASA